MIVFAGGAAFLQNGAAISLEHTEITFRAQVEMEGKEREKREKRGDEDLLI